MYTRASASTNWAQMCHIGGPTVLLEIGSLRFLTDPTFEPVGYRYSAGTQAVVKTSSPLLASSTLPRVDVVLLSHDQHADNLDPAGRAYLPHACQVLTTPAGARRLGANAHGVATGETVAVADASGLPICVTATPARHGPEALQDVVGSVNGWLLEWEGQRRGALYVSGDTVLFDGLEVLARDHRVGTAFLHFGAAQTQRFGPASLTLTAAEGARFAELLGSATIVPIHYEGWSHLTEGRREIEHAFAEAGLSERLCFLPQGQPIAIEV